MNIYSLGSGSKGNCMVISNGKTRIMVDAGLSFRTTVKKLCEVGVPLTEIDGVLLTHEHVDHTKSLKNLAEYTKIYSHGETLEAAGRGTEFSYASTVDIDGETAFCIGDIEVQPFRTSHDAAHPLGFVLRDKEDSVCYMTDTGFVSQGMMRTVSGCKKAIVESNHDKEMLIRGLYPEPLKQRILSDKGHLCNDETALAVADLVKSGATKFLLAHLSEQNNLGELAYWTTRNHLDKCGVEREAVTVQVARQRDTVTVR